MGFYAINIFILFICGKCAKSEPSSAEGAENGLEFTIVRPFNWIGPRMDFIPGVDGPSEGVPRVLACFSNVCSYDTCISSLIATPYPATAYHDVHAESPPPGTSEAC